jgi:tryptophanyl-tRNA synthetase
VVVDFVTPFRDRTRQLLDDRAELDSILRSGRQKAAAVAERTLADVYDRVGFGTGGR